MKPDEYIRNEFRKRAAIALEVPEDLIDLTRGPDGKYKISAPSRFDTLMNPKAATRTLRAILLDVRRDFRTQNTRALTDDELTARMRSRRHE